MKTEKGMEVYKSLTIGNFGTLRNEIWPFFNKSKLQGQGQVQGVYTKYLFDSEGTYDDNDDDEMIEESVVISIGDADEYIALLHQVERFDLFNENFEKC